jgi:hypothetical protein
LPRLATPRGIWLQIEDQQRCLGARAARSELPAFVLLGIAEHHVSMIRLVRLLSTWVVETQSLVGTAKWPIECGPTVFSIRRLGDSRRTRAARKTTPLLPIPAEAQVRLVLRVVIREFPAVPERHGSIVTE